MSNPIFNQFQQKQPQQIKQQPQQGLDILQQITQFEKMIGDGNPNVIINQLLASGKATP